MSTPTARGKRGSAALALGGEQPFRGERPLQPLDRGEVVAEPEALDRRDAEGQLALGLVELGPALGVHALAVGEVELERVEATPLHRRPQAGAAGRVLEREEDERPGLVAPQFGHLALDPELGQAAQVDPDPLVERGDAEDLAVAVERRLDLHPARVDASRRRMRAERRL